MLAFVLASTLIILAPGADMMLVVARATQQGLAAALSTVLGLVSGLAVHTLLVLFGVAALISANPWLFQGLILLGASYLAYLAYLSLRHFRSTRPLPKTSRAHLWHYYRQGVIANVLNIKVALFFMAFLPQFVDPSVPFASQILILGALFALLALLIKGGVAVVAAKIGETLGRSIYLQMTLNLVGGLVMLLIALNIVRQLIWS